MKNEELEKLYKEETLVELMDGFYYTSTSGELITFPTRKRVQNLTKVITNFSIIPEIERKRFETKISVENIDCLEKAEQWGRGTVVLNMASNSTPGGGVERGSKAQEEEIFRRTNLAVSLYPHHPIGQGRFGKQLDSYYPLDKKIIYSKEITIFKDKNYINQPSTIISVISAAATRNPKLSDGKLLLKDVRIWKNKISDLLRAASDEGHTRLILSAWGCGAYKNPPSEIAKLFKEILSLEEFKGVFEDICFAIIDDHNSNNNYQIFKEILDEEKDSNSKS